VVRFACSVYDTNIDLWKRLELRQRIFIRKCSWQLVLSGLQKKANEIIMSIISSNELCSYVRTGDPVLLKETAQVSLQLCQRIKNLKLNEISLSDYSQRYIKDNYVKPEQWAHNSLMFAWLLDKMNTKLDSICLLDYGAGAGSICLLAKALGIRTVIYTDIYDISCKDASTLGKALGLQADHYINGELCEIISFMKGNNLFCDVLVSNACIEHIYNIEEFFEHIPKIPSKNLRFWLSTGANPLRPRTKRLLSEGAVRAEYEDSERKWGHKDRDALKSFLLIRKDIIRDEERQLGNKEIEVLARKTRGLREDDIRKTVRAYVLSGRMPNDPEHPTNTCDPLTGNWAERLMNPFYLTSQLSKNGLMAEVVPLYWADDTHNRAKRYAKAATNLFMSCFPKWGLHFSPGYVLQGSSSK